MPLKDALSAFEKVTFCPPPQLGFWKRWRFERDILCHQRTLAHEIDATGISAEDKMVLHILNEHFFEPGLPLGPNDCPDAPRGITTLTVEPRGGKLSDKTARGIAALLESCQKPVSLKRLPRPTTFLPHQTEAQIAAKLAL